MALASLNLTEIFPFLSVGIESVPFSIVGCLWDAVEEAGGVDADTAHESFLHLFVAC